MAEKMNDINRLLKTMMGRKMTKAERQLQDTLRKLVKDGKITVSRAHEIWHENVKE